MTRRLPITDLLDSRSPYINIVTKEIKYFTLFQVYIEYEHFKLLWKPIPDNKALRILYDKKET